MRRRLFLGGAAAFIAAPAIVARANIMTIKAPAPQSIAGLISTYCATGDLEPVSWLVVHPDYSMQIREELIGVDLAKPGADMSEMVQGSMNERGEIIIGQIERFSIYVDRAERQLRSALEPKGSARWR